MTHALRVNRITSNLLHVISLCEQTVSVAPELRRPVYMLVAVKSIDYEQVLSYMSNARWDVREIMSQHNYYVDHLLRELQIFSMRINEVCSNHLTIPSLP